MLTERQEYQRKLWVEGFCEDDRNNIGFIVDKKGITDK